MTDTRDLPPAEGSAEWPLRPLLLAGIGLVTGLIAHLLLGNHYTSDPGPLKLAALAGMVLAAGLTGFTLERRRWWMSVAFALAVALVGALVVYWNGDPDSWGSGEGWRMVSLVLAIAIAAPLFQAARDEDALRFPYASVHDHAWTNVVLWAACWVFVGIVFALAWLLATLFGLIKIDFLKDLLEKHWFWRALLGFAFGAGLGLLREHDGVVRLLQRVVAMVLAVLAPVLAFGLVLFVLALPFTGLNALWDATDAATPILLSCVVGALILVNAVIGNTPAQERRFAALRVGALALSVVALPLAILAAIATGLRIDQYGFTPERLWALVFVMLAAAYGAGYLGSIVIGRRAWAARLRVANLQLAFGVLGVALLLATPIVSFNAISTRDQLARLESGRVKPEQFDWRALAFDFGAPGKAALKRLQASANAVVRAKAIEAGKAKSRYEIEDDPTVVDVAAASKRIRTLPQGASLPRALVEYVARNERCGREKDANCTIFMLPGETEALVLADMCFGKQPPNRRIYCHGPTQIWLIDGKWTGSPRAPARPSDAMLIAEGEAYKAGTIDVRPVTRRQVFVGGVPVGEAFE